jgi:hypothetical protein
MPDRLGAADEDTKYAFELSNIEYLLRMSGEIVLASS